MSGLLARYGSTIIGVLSGLDRMVFRGTLRQLSHVAGMDSFLGYRHVLLKNFTTYAAAITGRIRDRTEEIARAAQRPIEYVASSAESKEHIALGILQRSPVDEGLICVLNCVEPCRSYAIVSNRQSKQIELALTLRKCLHHYFYLIDRSFGLMHVRIQTWFPFMVQVCLNGREWLCRQLDTAGQHYERRDNTLAWVDDFDRAQQLFNKQMEVNWPRQLDRLLKFTHPLHHQLFPEPNLHYYWSVYEMEWASDLVFDSPGALAAIYPGLSRYAILNLGSRDIMRFLGHKLHGRFSKEVVSDYKTRPEGVRVKHRVGSNSVKMYDKQGVVLRIETTINKPRDLTAFRRPEGKPDGELRWRPVRKGVADIHRVAQISQRANDRYGEALAALADRTPVHELVDRVCRRATLGAQRIRALQPWSQPDLELLRCITHGEFVISGFRNRDLRTLLPHLNSAQVSRLLRILRAHGIIKKVANSSRYHVTKNGRRISAAVIAAHTANLSDLLALAA